MLVIFVVRFDECQLSTGAFGVGDVERHGRDVIWPQGGTTLGGRTALVTLGDFIILVDSVFISSFRRRMRFARVDLVL